MTRGSQELALVAAGHDLVTDPDDLPARCDHTARLDLAGGDQLSARLSGEGVDGLVVDAQQDDRLALLRSPFPGGEGVGEHLVAVATVDAAVGLVLVDHGRVAVAEPERRALFPRLAE